MTHGTPNLMRAVEAGTGIKPWLILGPFYEDLSQQVRGLTFFEQPASSVGHAVLADIVADAASILQSAPRESDAATFRTQTAHWAVVRRPEPFLAWGNYYIANHLGAAFLSTLVTPNEPGMKRWRLRTGITSQVRVAINGTVIFDSSTQPQPHTRRPFEYVFEAALAEGVNVLTIAMFRLARMAQISCQLAILDDAVTAQVPLREGMELNVRAAIEAELHGVSLERDLFYPDEAVVIQLAGTPGASTNLRVRLLSATGDLLHETTPSTAGSAHLCQGSDLQDGTYQIECAWLDDNQHPITSAVYDIRKTTPAPTIAGYHRMGERKQHVLAHFAHQHNAAFSHDAIWPQVARYAAQLDVDEQVVQHICAYITARNDCADFAIQGILRLLCWDRRNQRLSPQTHAMIKDTVLGFKYWVDEPGDTVMYMGSENHRLLFHVAEWLAGQLFPTEEFTNSSQRGLFHASKGRMFITEWLRQRGRFGFDEWHSNAYYPICIAPLLNVYDFAIGEDSKLRQMAGAVLDAMFFNAAADSFDGIFGTTHGRSYTRHLKHPDFDGMAATCWLLFGNGSLVEGTSGISPASIASSSYVLPMLLSDIATDKIAVIESRQRHGILSGSARHANFQVYRTPDYLLSGLQDHRKGEFEPSTHVAQVTLANKTVIFWSCPLTSGEGSGLRPDYWSGHITLPRVIQHRNVLALTWRLHEFAWMTHCFFEQARFDEVRFAGNWAIARVGDGYAAIFSQHGLAVGQEGQYAGRELVCTAPENTWLVECGRAVDWGSFDSFVAAVLEARIETNGDRLSYDSPSVGRFVTGWDVDPTVNEQPLTLRGYPLVASAWAHSAFGSGELVIHYGDQTYEVWFNQ